MTNNKLNEPEIIPIQTVFSFKNLTIPDYQRPYKWQEKNVKQLIDDIIVNKEMDDYRLGTIVLHSHDNKLDIVDGQQRMLTFTLISIALQEVFGNHDFFKKFENINSPLSEFTFDHYITRKNLNDNYKTIVREVKNFDESIIHFFYHHCKVVWVEIESISEAFQFFDSQNSRGKDLYPQDLLKAFHLREMGNNTEEERLDCVQYWEKLDQKELSKLFSNYLFRVRNWSKSISAEEFTKNEVDVFKGISLDAPQDFNFIKPYKINHFYTEMYNQNSERKIDDHFMDYPFQLDQIMINGKRFFEFVTHYGKEVEKLNNFNDDLNIIKIKLKDTKTKAVEILNLLDTYEARGRTGDLYVRNVFNCCMLYYIDKFGYYKLDEAIVRFFIWVYSPRIEQHSVRLKTIDNLGTEANGFFKIIRESINTKEIFYKVLHSVTPYGGNKDNPKTNELIAVFEELHYLN